MENITFEDELILQEKYYLTPNELYIAKLLLLAQEAENGNYLYRFLSISNEHKELLSICLHSLQSKGIILKSYNIPEKGEVFTPLDVKFNQNFIKTYHRASHDLGKELFDIYPSYTIINGITTSIKSVSRKFDSLNDFYRFYGKSISWNNDLHNKIIDLIKWAKETNPNLINCSLCNFVIDEKWNFLEEIKNGNIGNIDFNNIRSI